MTDPSTLADRVRSGALRFHALEQETDHDTATAVRRELLQDETGVDLEVVGDYAFPAEAAEANIENMVGAIQVPMGVAGPLPVDGEHLDGEYYLPLATTEGALVASVNRGCRVLREAGGVSARVTADAMTRAPVFAVDDLDAAMTTIEWVRDHEETLADVAEATTNHGRLLGIDDYIVGKRLFFRFRFATGDAMGMNMVTIATRAAAERIEAETPATLIALSGNLCSDKKPAAVNAVMGRGRTVTAEAVIPHDIVENVLHTSPESIAEIHHSKNILGSAKAGSYGFNAHAANIVGAAFLAMGQDEAHVVEGSNAIGTMQATDAGLSVTMTFASLLVGTVGGGTRLPSQREALGLTGLAGGGDPVGSNARGLAELIAAGALAGELSLLGALASRQLSEAHEQLGR